jgi:hypothetical protein
MDSSYLPIQFNPTIQTQWPLDNAGVSFSMKEFDEGGIVESMCDFAPINFYTLPGQVGKEQIMKLDKTSIGKDDYQIDIHWLIK